MIDKELPPPEDERKLNLVSETKVQDRKLDIEEILDKEPHEPRPQENLHKPFTQNEIEGRADMDAMLGRMGVEVPRTMDVVMAESVKDKATSAEKAVVPRAEIAGDLYDLLEGEGRDSEGESREEFIKRYQSMTPEERSALHRKYSN